MRSLLIALAFCSTIGLVAQERVDLTTPETKPTNAQYSISRLTLDLDAASIVVELKGQNGERLTKAYTPTTTPTGLALLTALNKANLSTRSLKQRVFDQLVSDGTLVGTVTGTVP